MKSAAQTAFIRANAAYRIKDYGRAIALYEEALTQAAVPLRSQILKNLELALRKKTTSGSESPLQAALALPEIQELETKTDKTSAPAHQDPDHSLIDFDPDYYLSKYSDLRGSQVDPHAHYTSHGKDEGREGAFNLYSIASAGSMEYDPAKKTLLIICHEASRTGAPILGLRIAESLSLKYNIFVWLGRNGPLLEEFRKHAFMLVDHDPAILISSGELER